jgi:hypothetical protein
MIKFEVEYHDLVNLKDTMTSRSFIYKVTILTCVNFSWILNALSSLLMVIFFMVLVIKITKVVNTTIEEES